jgi:putative N6-adenine-specific DNA methylase
MPLPVFLPCAAGVEAFLTDEVRGLLPAAQADARRGGVSLAAEAEDVMRLNLWSRLAQRVLVEVARGPYADEHGLYRLAMSVDWSAWATPAQTLRVDVTTLHSPIRSPRYAALRIKDAVCDQQREVFGERSSVDTHRPDLPLVLHLEAEVAYLYVDTSGEALFKRGWREDVGDAPLKETLAAAVLAAAGWAGRADAGGALNDPCCGSGTIAIEAAQIACGRAPGLQRRFAFERQRPFTSPERRAAWSRLRQQAQAAVHVPNVPIFASDVSQRMVDFARRNAERAGVAAAIEFHGGDALERPAPLLPPGMAGTLVLNPPYGERLSPRGAWARVDDRGEGLGAEPPVPGESAPGAETDVQAHRFAAGLAAHWKRAYTGAQHWTAWVLSPDEGLPQAMRLKPSRRVPLWNGPIECRLYRFDLVSGSMRDKPPRR